MALILNSNLLAAQNQVSDRHPLAKVLLRKIVSDIPLSKNSGVSPDGNAQTAPGVTDLADGSIVVFYAGEHSSGYAYRQLRMFKSDAAQTTFEPFISILETTTPITKVDVVKIDETTFGVVYQAGSGSSYEVRAIKVSIDGAIITNTQLWSGSNATGICVEKTGSTYTVVMTSLYGGAYYVSVRPSSDFSTWGTSSNLTIGGRVTTQILQDPCLITLQDSTYMLVLSYEDFVALPTSITNLYYTTSTDLSTWADLLPITNNDLPSTDYTQPDIVQQDSGALFISALKLQTYLELSASTTGWFDPGVDVRTNDVWLDSAAQKFYFAGEGNYKKYVVRMDIPTWTIDFVFHEGSNPPIPAYFNSESLADASGTANRAVMCCGYGGVLLMDFDAETCTPFYFQDYSSTYGVDAVQNVNWDLVNENDTWAVRKAWIDDDTNRLYVFIPDSYYHDDSMQMGYIDLTQTGPEYNFTPVLTFASGMEKNNVAWCNRVVHYPLQNLLLTTGANEGFAAYGCTMVFDTEANAEYKRYKRTTHPEFPHGGLFDAVIVDGTTIFGLVFYTTEYAGDYYKYWLCQIDLVTDTITYHYPTFESTKRFVGNTSYGRARPRMSVNESDGELIIGGLPYPVIFNYITLTFEYLEVTSSNTGPFVSDYDWASLVYDPISDMFFGQKHHGFGFYTSAFGVPRDGQVNHITYITGTEVGGGVWDFEDPERFVAGFDNMNGRITLDKNAAIWLFWEEGSEDTDNISWGKTGAEMDATSYFVGKLEIAWDLTGDPNELTIEFSHGHLFDNNNKLAILNYYLRKNNLIVIELGDKYLGSSYYQEQGSFVITEAAVKYSKNEYPTMSVVAHDVRSLWSQHQIVAVQVTSKTPKQALQYLVSAHTNFDIADVILPDLDAGFTFSTQWLDAILLDCMNDVANRFNYALKVSVENELDVIKLDFDKEADHIYTDNKGLLDYETDESCSSSVNKIIVTGQSLDDIEVIYAEERLGALSGTVGWWGFKKDFYVYYSDDKSKRARYPRLEILESTTSIMFMLAGKIKERIRYEDPDDKYCIVEIKAPNLIPILVTGLGIYALGKFVFDNVVTFGFVGNYGYTISWGRLIEAIGVTMCLMVLSSMGSYQYEIWGRPVGYVKRNYAESADDEKLQAQVGMEIQSKEEGFLCHSPAHCYFVANMEMDLLKAQRNKVRIRKVAHLQDELGDVLVVKHPYTGADMRLFVAKLKRVLDKKSGFFDEIEGWVV